MAPALNERALTTLALLLAGAALLVSTWQPDIARPERAFSPSFFPQIVLGIWCALAVAGLVADLRTGPGDGLRGLWRAGLLAVGLLAFAALMPRLGFALTAAGFCALALPLLGVRRPLLVAAYAILVPAGLVGLFNHLLRMPLPTSPFTYLF